MEILNKRFLFIALDVLLAVYLGFSMTSLNNEVNDEEICSEVNITISDNQKEGFLCAEDIKTLLIREHIYPKDMRLADVNPRKVEEILKKNPYVNDAECSKTKKGKVNIIVEQRAPVVHVMSENGEDYYVDELDSIMPVSNYTSNLLIATGNITKWYAQNYVALLCQHINNDELWRDQIEQVNILPDKDVELVPRVGDHIVKIGRMPEYNNKEKRAQEVEKFLANKLNRLDKFYRYGLSQAGWNKYTYINLEFDNQIICKKNRKEAITAFVEQPQAEEATAQESKKQDSKQETKKQDSKQQEPKKQDAKRQEPKKQDAKKQDTKKQENKKQG